MVVLHDEQVKDRIKKAIIDYVRGDAEGLQCYTTIHIIDYLFARGYGKQLLDLERGYKSGYIQYQDLEREAEKITETLCKNKMEEMRRLVQYTPPGFVRPAGLTSKEFSQYEKKRRTLGVLIIGTVLSGLLLGTQFINISTRGMFLAQTEFSIFSLVLSYIMIVTFLYLLFEG